MIVGGISLDVEDIISIRMNWAIQIELSESSAVSPPNRQTVPSRNEAYEQKVGPPADEPPSYKRPKGRYWTKDIVEWLMQKASPFWNTIRKGGSWAQAGVAYIGARFWNATGGRVVKFVAKQSLQQMVLRPKFGIASGMAAYFAVVTVVAHDIYVLAENNVEQTKFLGEGVKIGGGGFGS